MVTPLKSFRQDFSSIQQEACVHRQSVLLVQVRMRVQVPRQAFY
jgi:hypothetical protein